ncbi:MAG: AIPR family protein [Mariprofundaceae bacterium]|nr:AIPR family protein [Mariprofundaceae bacterium]
MGEAQSFLSGVKKLINKQFSTFNQNVKNMEEIIETALDECDEIKLIIAYTGDGVSIQAKNEIRQTVQREQEDGDEQLQQEFVEFDAAKVEEALRQEQAVDQVNEKIRIHKYGIIDNPRRTIFGIVKVQDLINLHERYDRKLYEKNIRFFIGAGKRGVHSAIKQTLLKEPDKFLYLNNGITLVGSSVSKGSIVRGEKKTKSYTVQGMSVVNGAQTIASAAQFQQENPDADISSAQVMLTLIHTGATDQFHKQVTKARNLQNPVDLSNFAALDDNQERLRQEIALYGMEYHYRPQRQVRAGIPVMDIETLVKALACLHKDIRYPARLKSEPSQFSNMESDTYRELFTDELSGSKAMNAFIAFQAIRDLLSAADQSSPSPERLVYRHCTYALASILMKRLRDRIEGDEVLDADQLKTLISSPFDDLRQSFADQYGLGGAPHAFFKRIHDTSRLIQKVAILEQDLAEDATVQTLQDRMQPNDPHNQALTNYLAGKAEQL